MIRTLTIIAALLPGVALAQTATPHPTDMKGAHTMEMHGQMMNMGTSHTGMAMPTQPGQGAFATIQEIVDMLAADPKTDWSKVNMDALRQHLIDMNFVTLDAQVKNEPIADGMRFVVTGAGPVRDSIQRMVLAHAATMIGVGGWKYEAAKTDDGAKLTVHVPVGDQAKLRGLGFIGVLTLGMHHQAHHMMIARGENPHG
ncbi:MAG: hypothetical protein KGQ46_09020 [Hyphomicrobiales bacterium]|nr:hypothetical protein [Hyphomicrobiales bacterium]MDE2113419.1 hypothetical protein [Hyphomicrobiales bacterium]